MAVTPGKKITIKVVKTPTNAGAKKTIARILAKDEVVAAEHKRQKNIRTAGYNPKRRGGRYYAGHIVKQHPIKGEVGEQGTIVATCDVIRDLRGIERFLEIS